MLRVYIILYLQLVFFVHHPEKKFKPPVVPRDAEEYVKSLVIDDLCTL